MPESIDDIADRLQRAQDRYQNANDFGAAHAARQAAERARRAGSVQEAQLIEQEFFRTRAQPPPDLSQNAGCLGNLFGGGRRGSWPTFTRRRTWSSGSSHTHRPSPPHQTSGPPTYIAGDYGGTDTSPGTAGGGQDFASPGDNS
jgi:hypothetical protein